MDIDSICKLPIHDISEKDCALFMWVTSPLLEESFKVIKAWGFQYKTVAFVWVKANKRVNIEQLRFTQSIDEFMGMGHWTRANAEFCLLATKGKIKRQSAKVRQIIYSPLEEHSKKPDETRSRITQLIGDLPRIELFARTRAEGWDAWGDQI